MKIYQISQIENIVQYKIRKENEAKKKQECKCGILHLFTFQTPIFIKYILNIVIYITPLNI